MSEDFIGTTMAFIADAESLTEQLNRILREAESRGFRNGMLHAADIAERATMNTEDLSSNEKIAVVITAERIVAAILKDADG